MQPKQLYVHLQDGNGNWVRTEFVKYHLDRDDPVIEGLTIYGDGPYGAPLTARAPVWGRSSTVDDEKLISIHNLFKRTVDNTLKDLENPGLTAKVKRYRALQQKLIYIQEQERELDHETSIQALPPVLLLLQPYHAPCGKRQPLPSRPTVLQTQLTAHCHPQC
jgi:hypothetical protein